MRALAVSLVLTRLVLASIVLAAALGSSLAAQTGHWEGVIKQEGRSSLFSLDLDNDPDWSGLFSIPGKDAPPLPLSGIEVHLPAIRFEIRELPGDPVFKGTLAEGGTSIHGTVTQGDSIVVFEMRHVGESTAAAIPKNTPVGPAFLGDWTGTVKSEAEIHLILHLRAGADGSADGTLDTADRRARNLLLSSISQSGNGLSFDVRLIGGRFQGELVSDDSRIAGSWSQGGRTVPLTFERAK